MSDLHMLELIIGVLAFIILPLQIIWLRETRLELRRLKKPHEVK